MESIVIIILSIVFCLFLGGIYIINLIYKNVQKKFLAKNDILIGPIKSNIGLYRYGLLIDYNGLPNKSVTIFIGKNYILISPCFRFFKHEIYLESPFLLNYYKSSLAISSHQIKSVEKLNGKIKIIYAMMFNVETHLTIYLNKETLEKINITSKNTFEVLE